MNQIAAFSLCLLLFCGEAYTQAYFVHGTNASGKVWNDEVRDTIRNIFGHSIYSDDIELKDWSGANNTKARELAAEQLLEHILKVIKTRNIIENTITIIGHSHGGNVVLLASKKLKEKLGENIEASIVTMNTPCVVGGAKLEDKSIKHYHIYSPQDIVVLRGGFDKTGIQKSGGEKKTCIGTPRGGEFSYPKNFESGIPGSVNRIFESAYNIEYKDQYKCKGFIPKKHLIGHRGWLPKNVRQWAPELRKLVIPVQKGL